MALPLLSVTACSALPVGARTTKTPLESASIQDAVGPLAQSVEQRTFNPWVVGSSPTGPTDLALEGDKCLILVSAMVVVEFIP